ncbi:MAG: ATP-binding protein [Flammeovirgaceae bacterium]|nr:ATP-binding protein [Flammeovirgaceae bacterium]
MKKALIACICCFTSVQLIAQNRQLIDSLKKIVGESQGETRFNALNDLGFEYRLSFPDSTILYCQQAYDLGVSIGLKKNLAQPLSFMGLAKKFNGDYKGAYQYHTQAIEVAESQNDSVQIGYCYNNFGRLYFDQGDISRAYDIFLKSQEVFSAINNREGLAYVYRSLSDLHKSQSDFPKALEASMKALTIRYEFGDSRSIISSLLELGALYMDMKSKLDAVACFEKADSIATRLKDQVSSAEIRIRFGEFLAENDEIGRASVMATEVLAYVERTNNKRLLPQALQLMGIVTYKQNNLTQAIGYFSRVISYTEKSHLDLQRDAYFYLSKIYERQGRQAEATQATIKYLILKESLHNVELARQIEKLQFQLEIEKKELENEQLKASETQKEAIIQQQRLQNAILIVVAVSITVLLFVQYRNSKKRREASEKLALQNEEIAKQDEEIKKQNKNLTKQNQLLSDLNYEKDTLMNIVAHDLKSPLNRIKGLIDLIEMGGNGLNEDQKKYLSLVKESTRGGIDLITDLLDVNSLEVNREPNYSIFDLNNFLSERVNVFRQHAVGKQIDIKFDSQTKELVFLDKEYLARIMDNLISNAIKFSPRNSIVMIRFGQQDGYIFISIMDQGPGFSSEDRKSLFQKFKKLSARPTGGETSNGLGLAIVKTLVDWMEGEIELSTQPDKGSEFTIRFPIKDKVIA